MNVDYAFLNNCTIHDASYFTMYEIKNTSYENISLLFKRYIADSKQYAISSSAHPLEQFNDFIEYYSAQCSNGKSLTGVIPVLKSIDQLFKFSAISK